MELQHLKLFGFKLIAAKKCANSPCNVFCCKYKKGRQPKNPNKKDKKDTGDSYGL